MFNDNSLSFNTNWSSPQAITTTADSTTVIDITGAGSGNAPTMINGYPATNTAIGEDYGAGAEGKAIPYLYLTVTTAGATANTVTVTLKAAPDNGSFSQGTYYTLYVSDAYAGTKWKKGTGLIVPVPPVPNNADNTSGGIQDVLPRFYKLTYTCSGAVTGLAVLAGFVLNPPSSMLAIQYPSNFTVV